MNRDDLRARDQSVEVESDVGDAGEGDGPDDHEDDGAFVHPGVVHFDVLRTPPESKRGCMSPINAASKFQPIIISYRLSKMILASGIVGARDEEDEVTE